ncbi:CDP-glycerol glycerophosphotransferase family protein [Gottfriedia acidiceleris]|uniref:CDP-glycerol glycerophosphotransferase family protein n=1 Tax=Gottfriedia acidiceleris TaxID=371036 RepID=UPI000B42E864|nr:CDP-glycerol glycerophosphotransferase family protein [Gottfriedia acidiceleris]
MPHKEKELAFNGQANAENLRVEDVYITFDICSKELKHANNVEFYIKKRNDSKIITLEVKRSVSGNKEHIIIPISQFQGKITENSRWDLSMELYRDNVKVNKRIGNFNVKPLSEKDKRVGYLMLNETFGIAPYLALNNEFSFHFCTPEQYMNTKYPVKTKIHKLSINKQGVLKLTASINLNESHDFVVNHITLRLRQDKSHVIQIPCTEEMSRDKNSRTVKAELNISQLELEQFYWDIYISITIDNGDVHHARLRNDNYLISKKLKHGMLKYTVNTSDNYMIYPYITANDYLALTYRQKGEFESLQYKINEYMAFILYSLLFWYFTRKPIWLIHEKYSETAQDNSFYFFKYCYENQYNKKVYYVIKKGSPDEKNLAPYKKRVVYFMSFKHLFLLLASKLIVSSETKGHGFAWRVSQGVIRDFLYEKKYVFLQHGVLGLKKVGNSFKAKSSNGADLFVVSSDFEKEIVKREFGYKEENVIVTGLSRWDVLKDKSHQNTKKEIFLMPTWRNWLEEVEDDKFILSDYYHVYNGLIQSEKLSQLLKDNDITLNFYVHPKFMPYVENFTSSNEHINVIQFGEANINELIMRSSLLITDYSSVAWETYYQKKPVLFFHFDLDKYLDIQGSYMDLRNDVFGEVAYASSELVDKLSVYINNGFKEKDEFSLNRNYYFKHVDQDNSARIFKYISEREKSLVKWGGVHKLLKRSYLLKSIYRRYNQNPLVRRISTSILSVLK